VLSFGFHDVGENNALNHVRKGRISGPKAFSKLAYHVSIIGKHINHHQKHMVLLAHLKEPPTGEVAPARLGSSPIFMTTTHQVLYSTHDRPKGHAIDQAHS